MELSLLFHFFISQKVRLKVYDLGEFLNNLLTTAFASFNENEQSNGLFAKHHEPHYVLLFCQISYGIFLKHNKLKHVIVYYLSLRCNTKSSILFFFVSNIAKSSSAYLSDVLGKFCNSDYI